jgi:hypothetical protein
LDCGRDRLCSGLDIATARSLKLAAGPRQLLREEIAMTEIKEHMSIIGKDGVDVGTVDHIEGDRIKLTRKNNPPGHEGHHHYIAKDLVGSIEGEVIKLTVNGMPRREREKVAKEFKPAERALSGHFVPSARPAQAAAPDRTRSQLRPFADC